MTLSTKNGIETHTLVILCGPTGVGKTSLSLRIAEHFHSPVISSDSRQIYKDIPIGTDAPCADPSVQVRHYMTGILELTDYYSAANFEADVLSLLEELHKTIPVVIMAGGSMMYIDAISKGIDDIPSISPDLREAINRQYEREGLNPILEELKNRDPIHYEQVDRKNPKRVIHALEVCRQTGKPYSAFRTNSKKERPFRILKIGLTRSREELYERINRRVEQMMANGLLEEARRVYPFKHLNALNTVGYKELFRYLDGNCSLGFAVDKIKRNTRVYARKQMTWFKRDNEISWFHPDNETDILQYIHDSLENTPQLTP
ncbi:MAG: tRNA (adenosine(37)-N6)-dimethylallyltransferase MiaA [Tannerellaceae bacterium]|jgi:tRNA dimethylallyltransferase|nr:tRNA (adenosine(37)-N6)-dimethylallyltransferase MiaA [Tannerellaceae bacterium]